MRMNITIAVLGAIVAGVALGDVTGSITTEGGETHKGTIRWSVREKAYIITRGGVEMQIKGADVAETDIDKPAAFDAAVALVQKGQGEKAIPSLKKIVSDYQHLQWDKAAGRYLAEAYVAAGKPDDALRACADIIKSEPSASYRGELAPAYWNALLSLGKTAALEKALEKAAKSGDRFSSGAALIMRGDIIRKAADTTDGAKKALADGYLRVVYLYRDASVAQRLQPEALYKAALCFEKLGQSGRAEAMRAELKRSYASSPWAAK